MEMNDQLELAFSFLQYTCTNVFLTGKAGTGKTTFLHKLKEISPKSMIVLAPTGVAAINAGGVTIHSFFQLPFGPYVVPKENVVRISNDRFTNKFSREKINIIRSLDLLVIDEISMVRADLLDAVNDMLCRYRDRSKPFGGVQLLMIGDLQQLSPVVKEDEWELLRESYESPYFFNSLALRRTPYISIELTHVYRQADQEFITLLNKIRDNKADQSTLEALNKRYIPGFSPDENEGYITLTTHNAQAQLINFRKLEAIDSKSYTYLAEVKDEFPPYLYPTDERLVLKNGAQVMFVKNDSSPEKRYYNGKIGKIISIGKDHIVVKCREDEEEIEVEREEWTNTRYTIDAETREITETIDGIFTQYPLKTAWAITIHKSQGLTFEHAVIDAASAFTHGQVYVALSRCKTLNGLVLGTPLRSGAIISDRAVQVFTESMEHNHPDKERLNNERRTYFIELLTELFDYDSIWRQLQHVASVFGEYLGRLYPELTERYRVARDDCYRDLVEVGERFGLQLKRLVGESMDYENDTIVIERLEKGLLYFKEKTEKIISNLLADTDPEIDSKEVRKIVEDALNRLYRVWEVKIKTLESAKGGFEVNVYLAARAKASVGEAKAKLRKKSDKVSVSGDILHPELYNKLRKWRQEEADKLKLPVYTIMQQKALIGVTNTLPTNSKELMAIPGIGKKVAEKYGAKLLEFVDAFRFQN